MNAKSVYPYFFFGTAVRFLQDANPGRKINGPGEVRENIKELFEQMDSLNLQVTKRAAWELKEFDEKLGKMPTDAVLDVQHAHKLWDLVNQLRKTLSAELRGFEAYLVTPKRIEVQKLLGGVPALIAPGVFQKLDSIAQFDLKEAGVCIAFERSTAAAFHLLRGTESVLRSFYRCFVKNGRVDPMLWAAMTTHMRAKKRLKEHTLLLNNLDNIRLNFRNPTAHPEKIYDIQEVQDLWGLCTEAINRMASSLPAAAPP